MARSPSTNWSASPSSPLNKALGFRPKTSLKLAMRDFVAFHINGQLHQIRGAEVFQTLSSYLRYQCRLTGTKVVCAEGDCGACTVMVAKGPRYHAVNSCIAMTFALDGASLVTVEGLGEPKQLDEIQESMVRN